ncbi:hypothetical protein J4417_00995 [Candidatus Woesearchaeota archaeon]|nr:hypothetical protein [Candidatus Woesearchaeota archaeon]
MLFKQRRLMATLSILLSYVAVEIAIAASRFFDYASIAKDYTTFLEGYKKEHNFFFHIQKPDAELGFVYGTSSNEQIRLEQYLSGERDELGFRNFPGDKETGKITIVGDSFSHGQGVSVYESWPKRLESDLGIKVANLAVSGSNPTQYNLIMKRYKQYLENRVILYGVYVNDFTDNIDILDYEESGRNQFKSPEPSFFDLIALLEKKPFFERTLAHNLYGWLYQTNSRNIMKTKGNEIMKLNGENLLQIDGNLLVRGENEIRREWLSQENKTNFLKTLASAKDIAEGYGSTLVVVYFPSRVYIYAEEYEHGFSDKEPIKLEEKAKILLKEYAQKLDLLFIDSTPALKQERHNAIPIYLFKDVHFSPHGNEIVAQEIASALIDFCYIQSTKTEEISYEPPTKTAKGLCSELISRSITDF